MVGQGCFQLFSDGLQPKHGGKALQKQRKASVKTRKPGEEKPLQLKTGWKEPCPTTLKMSSGIVDYAYRNLNFSMPSSRTHGITSRCHVTVVAVASCALLLASLLLQGHIYQTCTLSRNSSSNSWVVGQGFFQPFSDCLQPNHGWQALQKQRDLGKTRKLGEENPPQAKK